MRPTQRPWWCPWTKSELLEAFAAHKEYLVVNHQGVSHRGVISSIQHEDGSGTSFNLRFHDGQTMYLRAT